MENIKVKNEKIDLEVERKIEEQLLNVKVKEEPLTKSLNENADTSDSSSEADEEETDKKNVEPAKSSNELLAELFQVFNAAPPVELLNDEDLLKKTKHKVKKPKKEKRKKHKKNKTVDVEKSDSNQTDLRKEKHKHKKKKKHKNKDEENERERSKSKEKDKLKTKAEKSEKIEKDQKTSKDRERTDKIPLESKEIKKEKDSLNGKVLEKRKRQLSEDEKTATAPPSKISTSIQFSIERRPHRGNSFYNGYTEHSEKEERKETERLRKSSERSEKHNRSSKEHIDRHDHLSDLSLSDEETYLRERERIAERSVTEDRRRDYGRNHSSRSRHDYDRRRPGESRSNKRSRSRSRSHDLGIDKKRLLEIARKNAISMFKRGNLPGCANMSEDVKDKVLMQMRYGGRTVQDLTDFCKKISNGEPFSELSSDNDSDIDRNGNVKPFHHPFQVKERDPIVLQMRSVAPIPLPTVVRKEDHTKAITMQFPVSSGQEHRMSESWVPVETKPATAPPLLAATTPSTNIFKQNVQKNVFQKPLPVVEKQEPAFKPLNQVDPSEIVSPETKSQSNSGVTPVPAPVKINPFKQVNIVVPRISVAENVSKPTTFIAEVPIPSSTKLESVFPVPNLEAVDVSNIISKRLSALRRLQENPMDTEAIKMMYNSQKEMSCWASSKHIPGQFTGSTGANVLKVHELNAGPQVWARRDQLTSTKPVTGGMGMHLLQKMGWKPGEGLGREKTGALQPLQLDVKLDKRGLVAKDDNSSMNGGGIRTVNNKKKCPPNNMADVNQVFQNKHPVCILNELSSKRKWVPPLYELVNEGGPSHNKKFLFSVTMNGQKFIPEIGANTKKEAKMLAAKFFLEQTGILQNQAT